MNRPYQRVRVLTIFALVITACIVTYSSKLWVTEEEVTKDEIICSPDDFRSTPFIDSLKKNDTVTVPSQAILNRLSREELSALYHRYISNLQYLCKNKLRLGLLGDGGWDICGDDAHLPTKPCLVYSFGINNDFSFDDDVTNKLGCEIHSFDPSMQEEDHQRGEKSFFHKLGLAGSNMVNEEGWSLKTLSSIRTTLGHTETELSVLKFDIETWEWSALESMIVQRDLLTVPQFSVELHLQVLNPEQNRDVYLRALIVLGHLYDLGYRIFWTNVNTWCIFTSKCKQEFRSNCYDVGFVRLKDSKEVKPVLPVHQATNKV